MTIGSEISLGTKIWGWAKQVVLIGKRIATLEARVTALEEALANSQPTPVPFVASVVCE